MQSDAGATKDESELYPLQLQRRNFQELPQAVGDGECLGEKWKASARAKVKAAASAPAKNPTARIRTEPSHRGESVEDRPIGP